MLVIVGLTYVVLFVLSSLCGFGLCLSSCVDIVWVMIGVSSYIGVVHCGIHSMWGLSLEFVHMVLSLCVAVLYRVIGFVYNDGT